MRIVLVAALLTNSVVGSLCMMPMASAQTMPEHQEVAAEMNMTPMAPMSHADCADCPHHEDQKEPAPQSSSCAGHCLSHATNTSLSNVVLGYHELVAALPVSIPVAWSVIETVHARPLITSPPALNQINTVVLRL